MMRILFVVIGNEHRVGAIDGDTVRYGSVGVSGTDQSVILVAEHLAASGQFEPVIACMKPSFTEVRGVFYTNLQLDGVGNRLFDVLVNMLWFEALDELPIEGSVKALITWCHMQYFYALPQVIAFAQKHGCMLGVVSPSEWAQNQVKSIVNHVRVKVGSDRVVDTVIANPLMSDVLDKVLKDTSIERKPKSIIFHSSWNRGRDLAISAFHEMMWDCEGGEFHCFDYGSLTFDARVPNVYQHLSADKATVARYLKQCEYFVYPLVRNDGEVHKDTFACVVAEACAMGCIVLTYPIGALPEVYGNCLAWLDFPEGVKDIDHLRNAPLSKEEHLLTTEPIKVRLRQLESDPGMKEKEELRNSAQTHVLERYSSDVIGEQWIGFLQRLLNS